MINHKLDLSDYETEWQASDGSKWLVSIEFKVCNGRAEASTFAIRPLHKSQKLSQAILRELPFRKMAMYSRERPDSSVRQQAAQRRLRLRRERQQMPHRGSSRLTHEEIQETIDCFLEAFHSGMPTIKHVATGLGIAESTANKRIIKLRREGLLPPSRLGENSLSK
jgi:hypothetical protein